MPFLFYMDHWHKIFLTFVLLTYLCQLSIIFQTIIGVILTLIGKYQT